MTTDSNGGHSDQRIERQAVAALKWAAFSKFASQLVSWAVTIVVLRLLMPEDYGLMAILTVIISLLGSIAELGLGSSIVQAPRLEKRDLSRLAGLIVVANTAACVVVVIAAPVIASVFGDERLMLLVRVASLQFLLNAISTLPQAVAYRKMDFRWLAWIDILAVLIGSLATLLLAWRGAGVWALVAGGLLQGGVRATLLLRVGWVRPEFSLYGVRHFLEFGGMVTLGRLLWQVVFQSDVLIAARRLTPDAVGLYSVSLHLATLPMQKIMGVINQVAFPAVARLQDEADRLRARLVEASQLLTVFSVAALWGISAVAPELVRVVLGRNWIDAIFPLQVITLLVPVRMINAFFSTAVIGVGKARLDLVNSLVCALVLPAAFFVGTNWGVDGLALSWLVGTPIVTAINLPVMARAVGVPLPAIGQAIWQPVVAGIAMYGAILVGRWFLRDAPDGVTLPMLVLVGATVYLFVLNAFLPSLKGRIGQLLRAAR